MKLIKAIQNRKSIRAFADKPVEQKKLNLLFEAARWAPSSRNEQPWTYFYAEKKDQQAFDKFIGCLNPGNQVWAKNAPLILLSVAKRIFDYKSRQNKHFMHDVGAANVSLALQATEMRLQAHQMAGYNRGQTLSVFQLDEEKYEPASFIAVGYPGDPGSLPEDVRKKETKPRIRKDQSDFVIQIESK